jgi:hypothetical protein
MNNRVGAEVGTRRYAALMGKLPNAMVVVSLCLVAGGCGSGSGSASSSQVSSPIAAELSYFPTGSPLVATIATDPNGTAVQHAQGLLDAFPLSQLGISALESRLSSVGLNYQTDIEPLYGNPVTVGLLQVPGAVSLSGSNFLAVWRTQSAAKLGAVVKKLRLTQSGTLGSATIYRAGSTALAVDGATAVFGASAADVNAALDRHAHGGGITSADFSSAMGNLPQNTIMQAFGSVTGALSGSGSAAVRKVPWVAAIRSYAASISAGSAGVTAQFRIDTAGGTLTSGELPIAAGTAAPGLAGTLPIAVGVRDPAQTLSFFEAAEQAVDPTAYAGFTKRDNAAKRKAGYDLSTFTALLTGNSVIESDTKATMARADVSDRASAARQLATLPQTASDIFRAKSVTKQPGGFYTIKEPHGASITLGLVGDQFVAGMATPAQLRAFATAPTTPVHNAQGSIAFRVGVLDLLRIVLKGSPGAIVQTLLSNLGNIAGSVGGSTSALTGSLALGVK